MQETIHPLRQWLKQASRQVKAFWQTSVLGQEGPHRKPSVLRAAEDLALQGLHHMLRYDQYDEDTGLFYNDNSVAFCFEVSPQTGADEDMVGRLLTLFTPIPSDHGIQWCLFADPVLDDFLDDYVALRDQAILAGQTSPFFQSLAQIRAQYVRRARGRSLWPNENFTIKNFRLLFSVTRTASIDEPKVKEEMQELSETLLASLKTAHLPAVLLDAPGLIAWVWPLLNPKCMFENEPLPNLDYDPGKPIKCQMTAFGEHVTVTDQEMLWGLSPSSEKEPDTRVAMRGFSVLQYPPRKELWEMANIIGSFMESGLQYPCPFLICGGIFTLDRNQVDTQAQLKSMRAKQNAQSKMAFFQPELVAQAQDWEGVVHQLDNGGNICQLYHTLLLFAPKKDMNKASQIALNIWRNERFTLVPMGMLQLSALYISLPMTLTERVQEDLKKMRLPSTKTTVNAVDLAPALAEWKGAGEPVMMFFGRRGSLTFVDFYSNQQGNYNVFVAGVSGSGKSVAMNEIISAYRGVGARVWVIDVGRSYKNLIALQKGTFLEFGPGSGLCLNPFSWVGTDSEVDFKSELRMLKPMIGRMASPNAPLTEFQYSLIAEAIEAVWAQAGPETNPTLIRDYLQSHIKDEKDERERVAHELAKQLQPFTQNGVYGEYFNGPANLTLDDDMIGLELEELKNAPELRRVVLFVLTSRIAHDMYLSRDRKKICLVDEAWQLLGSDRETAEFIEEGYRRARKYNGIFCVGTQGIEDAYKNEAAQAAYSNADWKILLRQDRKNLEKLIEDGLVSFSPAVKRMLLSLRTERGRYSEMMISSPNGDAVVRHIPDPFSLLMASTNATDFNACNRLIEQGYSTEQALMMILQERGQLDSTLQKILDHGSRAA